MVSSEEAQLSSLSHGLQKFSILTHYGQRFVAPNHPTQFSASDCIMMLATCIPLSCHSQKVSPIRQLIPYNQRNITLSLIYRTRFLASDHIIMTLATCIPLFHYLQKSHHIAKGLSLQLFITPDFPLPAASSQHQALHSTTYPQMQS